MFNVYSFKTRKLKYNNNLEYFSRLLFYDFQMSKPALKRQVGFYIEV